MVYHRVPQTVLTPSQDLMNSLIISFNGLAQLARMQDNRYLGISSSDPGGNLLFHFKLSLP